MSRSVLYCPTFYNFSNSLKQNMKLKLKINKIVKQYNCIALYTIETNTNNTQETLNNIAKEYYKSFKSTS